MSQESGYKSWMGSLDSSKNQLRGLRPAFRGTDDIFLRSWLVYDSSTARDRSEGSLNWNFLTGVLLAAGASAGFWAGIGMAIANWK